MAAAVQARGPDPAAPLMQAVAAGDEAAFRELMERYQKPLYAFLVRHVGDGPDVDDLFQETWMRVVRSAHRYDPSKRFSTWLFQIALNLCRDRGRRRKARPEQVWADPHEANSALPPTAAPEYSPEAALLRGESVDRMRAAIAQLPEAQREVVLLRYHQQLSESEVAEAAGVPRGTVKSRLHAGIKKLRGLLGPRNDGAEEK